MLTFAFEMPPESTRGRLVVVLILEKENLDRMKQADPLDVLFKLFTEHMNTDVKLRDVDLVVAYEEDSKAIASFQKAHDLAGLMRYIERGREIRPGDLIGPRRFRIT